MKETNERHFIVCQDVIFFFKSTFFFTHTQKVMSLPSFPLPEIQGQHKWDHRGSVAAQEVRRLGNWVNM